MNDIANKTGADNYKKAPEGMKVNRIRLNGENGKFYYQDVLNRKEGEPVEEKEIGSSVSLAFLKIRRILSYFDPNEGKNGAFIRTSEDNSGYDYVKLYGKSDQGIANDVRERNPDLRTQQIVYCLYGADKTKEPEIVALVVKGASLGSQNQADGRTNFYAYLQSFGQDEHVHEYVTTINAVEEVSKMKKKYFAMDFKRNVKLPVEKLEQVRMKIDEVYEVTSKQDAYYKGLSVGKVVAEEVIQMDAPEYPEEEINPDDIPF